MLDFNGITKRYKLCLFNTKTRKKEELVPYDGKTVRMYTCGPTVYNYAHIGNLRTYIFEDVLRRTVKWFGFPINQVMNITDVDDKTIRGAIKGDISLTAFTQPYKDAFFEDKKTLHIESAEHYPAATEYIEEMIAMIQSLIDKGYAYKGNDGSVYFSINKFSNYGKLSNLKLEELQSGASERVNSDEYDKENIADFVLWKGYDAKRDGSIFWESPFGKGRPGWHLECSTMAMKILGETIDIHCGGVDNIFPHHENEIAQSECFSGCEFSKLWVHSEHLIVDNKKMSKSLGNFYTLRDILEKGYSGIQVRYMLMQTHYKTQLNFTFEGLAAAKASLERLQDFIYRLQNIKTEEGDDISPLLKGTIESFSEALADDLNISAALGALFDLVKNINTLCDQEKLSSKAAKNIIATLMHFDHILGILNFENKEEDIPKEVCEALEQRQQARKEKDWARADELRSYITSQGYLIEDGPQGARLKKQ